MLATNTSALSVTEMASKLEHPERVVGLHFFNPVAVLPLLEVVRAEQTDDAALATAFAVGKALKKSCVLVADAPAFVVNRLLTRFLGEITAAVEQGTPVAVADRALDPLGLPMSPFDLLTLVGPPVALHVAERMHEAFPDRFAVGEGLKKMVELGKSSVYCEPGVVDPDLAGIDAGDSPLTEDEVRARAERALAQEIALMLDEGVVQAVQDIDLCMLLGAGWPFWLGGISAHLDRTGVSEAVTGKRFLPKGRRLAARLTMIRSADRQGSSLTVDRERGRPRVSEDARATRRARPRRDEAVPRGPHAVDHRGQRVGVEGGAVVGVGPDVHQHDLPRAAARRAPDRSRSGALMPPLVPFQPRVSTVHRTGTYPSAVHHGDGARVAVAVREAEQPAVDRAAGAEDRPLGAEHLLADRGVGQAR